MRTHSLLSSATVEVPLRKALNCVSGAVQLPPVEDCGCIGQICVILYDMKGDAKKRMHAY